MGCNKPAIFSLRSQMPVNRAFQPIGLLKNIFKRRLEKISYPHFMALNAQFVWLMMDVLMVNEGHHYG
jgi:hypothetical protein